MIVGSIAALVYGALALAGGVMGYKQAGSKASLISGIISGALLVLGGVLTLLGQAWGLLLAAIVAGLLIVVFVARLAKTRKLMPAAPMIVLGAVSLAVLVNQISNS
ncbi:small integral membrane protein [Rubidibacter lacunae KORDI 51-2]|uniref:Small integral membrane protein n=1 Tax=Rubidibacter lacunae KORDI 51-2 TaxID=582515 RepID=U5DMB7_9CHRO|nr:TMEM14 family protein [Rubidibacter lacunae]ERN42821.1 small integral membrane protein [Rubidibacter lacunae KORDI 51-2]